MCLILIGLHPQLFQEEAGPGLHVQHAYQEVSHAALLR